jgi:hypothetical protein
VANVNRRAVRPLPGFARTRTRLRRDESAERSASDGPDENTYESINGGARSGPFTPVEIRATATEAAQREDQRLPDAA